jgi:polyphosphate kinase
VDGVSENITVSSIVDRYLEHSRIFYFENGGSPRLFISSADWMPRNLDHRIEVLTPVEDPAAKNELINILEINNMDNLKRRDQHPDGLYEKPGRRGVKHTVRAQAVLYEQAVSRYEAVREEEQRDIFKLVPSPFIFE